MQCAIARAAGLTIARKKEPSFFNPAFTLKHTPTYFMSINFFFRSPVFPVIFDIGMGAACAETPSDLESYLIKYGSRTNTDGELIDYHYEGFMLIPDKLLVSPLTMKKKYTKKDLLQFLRIVVPSLNQQRLDAYSKESVFILAIKALQKN